VARSPALYPLLSCAPILGLLCGTAGTATANGTPAFTATAYPPPAHLRVLDDWTANEIEFRRKHADRPHQTDQAVDTTWRL